MNSSQIILLNEGRIFQHKFLPTNIGEEVQTRSEITGTIQHKNLHDAIQAATEDKTIWKISYQSVGGWGRVLVNESHN